MCLRFIKLSFMSGFVLIVMLLTSCISKDSSTGINENTQGSQVIMFDAREAKVGDSINNLIINKLDVTSIDNTDYYASVQFKGEMVLSGELNIFNNNDESSEGWGLGNYFQPDEESSNKIPVLNYEPTRNGFSIEDNTKDTIKNLSSGIYQVTIRIRDYEIWSLGKGQENKAKLIELLDYMMIE